VFRHHDPQTNKQRRLADRQTVPRLVWNRLRTASFVTLAVVVVSTLGYSLIEEWSVFDALYMTVITIATIGYGEVRPLDTSGRIWTMGLIAATFLLAAYSAAVISGLFLTGELVNTSKAGKDRRMRDRLDQHVIVVGYGRVGRSATAALTSQGVPTLVIDMKPADPLHPPPNNVVWLQADGLEEETLLEAGLDRCVALIAAARDDPTNLVIVLTAKSMRPELRVVARLNDSAWRDRLARAGADLVMSPYETFGTTLAAASLEPGVVDLHDLPLLGFRTEEIQVQKGSPVIGETLASITSMRDSVLALGLRRDDRLHRWHDFNDTVRDGDVLLVIGPPEELSTFALHVAG
jgi:voltage-gated potassium channel